MIDFNGIYESLKEQSSGNQRRLSVKSPLGVFFGYNQEGLIRLSFISKCEPPKLSSTKNLLVSQGKESDGVYWTCYDLASPETRKVFFTFCENLIEAVTGELSEKQALTALKRRYISWKSMFKKEGTTVVSHETLQGLFGELYYLRKFMIPIYGVEASIRAWSGPDQFSKDFSIGTDWVEIKTVGANSDKVKISSSAQLSSAYVGKLAIIRVEEMSKEFSNGESSISELLKQIVALIQDEVVEELFLGKISSYGCDVTDDSVDLRFCVKSISLYRVDDKFPRLSEGDQIRPEMCDIEYSLIISSLSNYLEE